jgi:hypothetical protein
MGVVGVVGAVGVVAVVGGAAGLQAAITRDIAIKVLTTGHRNLLLISLVPSF